MSKPVIDGLALGTTLLETDSTLSASGTLNVVDADPAHTVQVNVRRVAIDETSTFAGVNPLGRGVLLDMMTVAPLSLAADPPEGSPFEWQFNSGACGDRAFDFLGQGETLVLTYKLKATDDDGEPRAAQAFVTVTIVGTNDAPVFLGRWTHAARTETDTTIVAAGTLRVRDADQTDTVSVEVRQVAIDPASTFAGTSPLSHEQMRTMMAVPAAALAADPWAGSTFEWRFTSGASGDAAFDFLAQGETLVLAYTLEAIDDAPDPGTATQAVTITLEGSNDAPLWSLQPGDRAEATQSEDQAGQAIGGTLTVRDTDLSDSAAASVAAVTLGGATGTLGADDVLGLLTITSPPLAAEPGDANNLAWSFGAATGTFEYLEAGESLVLNYVLRVTDGSGAAAKQTVAVTIAGADEGPLVFDLGSLPADQGFVIQGDSARDFAGSSVSSAGDVNGDGFCDLIVGAPNGDDGGDRAGEAYVVFGKAGGFGAAVGGRQVVDLTSLGPAEGFVVQGAAHDPAGFSVSSAGDVNGDGFDDLVVGAPYAADGGDGAGVAYVVFGKAGAFGAAVGGRQVIDVASLAPADGFVIQGDTALDYAGSSVSSAGDVNGDGFGDLIVGARYGDDGGDRAGEAYVVFGKASGFGAAVGGRQVVDLTRLAPFDGFVVQGDAACDYAGFSVSSAGDVNGDGFGDLIVGAPYGDDGGRYAGEAYVVFGKAGGFGAAVGGRQVIDLTSLAAADGFVVQGDAARDRAGASVSSAGDVNGDGFGDLIVGARDGDDGGSSAGEGYVVFGKASGFGAAADGRQVIDLSSLAPADGFVVQGDAAGDWAGFSVSTAGDVNGDGFGDLIVGAPGRDEGGSYAGEAYVIFGRATQFGAAVGGRQVLDLGDFFDAPGAGFVVRGDAADDLAGIAVAAAGDIDRDGFDDLIVGAPRGDDGGSDAGEAYVLFGGSFGASAVPVSRAGTPAAEELIGGVGDDELTSGGGADALHAGAGDDRITVPDLDFRLADGGSGTDTLVLAGAGRTFDFTALPDNRTRGIEAIDIGGAGDNTLKLDLLDVFNLSDAPHAGFTAAHSHRSLVVDGDAGDALELLSDDGAWQLVASDVSLDGSAPGGYDSYALVRRGSTLASVAVDDDVAVTAVTLGSNNLPDITVASGDSAAATIVETDAVLTASGTLTVVDADPADDVTVSVVYVEASGATAGLPADLAVLQALLAVGPSPNAADPGAANNLGWTFEAGPELFDHLREAEAVTLTYIVRAADGLAGYDEHAVAITVQGTIDVPVIDLTSLSPAEGFVVQGDAEFDRAGFSVSSAGDVNGDGFGDLIVGARYGGEACVVFGKAGGFGAAVGGRQAVDLTSLAPADGFVVRGDGAGFSVSSVGDVNGDGFGDLIVGAPPDDYYSYGTGEAYVVFGKAGGFGSAVGGRQVVDLSRLSPADGFVVQGDAANDYAGFSVSSAGDVNGDGFDDLIVGAPYGDDGGRGAGEAYVVFGRAGGFGAAVGGRQVIDLTRLAPADGFVVQGDTAYDGAGFSVSSAGDVNGDGFGDLIVGAPRGNDGGEAHIVFGKAGGFGTAVGGRQVVDLTSLAPADGFVVQGDTDLDRAGSSVSSAGDVNGDGFGDLIVGAPGRDDGGSYGGEAYVIFGRASPFGAAVGGRQVLDLGDFLEAPGAGFVVRGDAAGDLAGTAVAAAGDIDRDGFDDLIVGAPSGDDGGSEAGEAYVIFGGSFGAATVPVIRAGTPAAENLIAGAGDDELTGGGGADALHAGAGDDRITVPDLDFRLADGGSGTDTLALAGAGRTFDFTALPDNRTSGIEAIDIGGAGDNTLRLDLRDVRNLSDTPHAAFDALLSHSSVLDFGPPAPQSATGASGGDGSAVDAFGAVPGDTAAVSAPHDANWAPQDAADVLMLMGAWATAPMGGDPLLGWADFHPGVHAGADLVATAPGAELPQ